MMPWQKRSAWSCQGTGKRSNNYWITWSMGWLIFWVLIWTGHGSIAWAFALVYIFIAAPIIAGLSKGLKQGKSATNKTVQSQAVARPLTYQQVYRPYDQGYQPTPPRAQPTEQGNAPTSSEWQYEQPHAQYPEQLPPMS